MARPCSAAPMPPALIMSLFGAAAPFGFVAGGAMASLFAQFATWPWAFCTLAAVCFALGALSVVVLPSGEPARGGGDGGGEPGSDNNESTWAKLDMVGILLGVSGLVLFNFTFNRAAEVTWNTPYIYFQLIISLLLLTGFVYVEGNAAHPLLPLSAMCTQTNFVLACTAAVWDASRCGCSTRSSSSRCCAAGHRCWRPGRMGRGP
jgi:hypothetical protein